MKPRNHKKILKKSLVIFSRIIAIFFAVLLIIVTLLNVPAVQTSITKKIAARISRDYHIDISLGTVKIALPKTLSVGQLFIAGRDRDTLLYLNRLDVDLGILGLLRNEVKINSIEIDQLTGNVFRGSPGSAYNFQFILDAFAGDSLTPETSAAPWKISVGKISLKAIKGRFRDETLGMDALIDLGNLEIRVESIDLNSLSIVLAELKLENTRGKLEQWTVLKDQKGQTSPNPVNDEDSSEALPVIGIKHFSIKNTNFEFNDLSGGLFINCDLGTMLLDQGEMSLGENEIGIGDVLISDTRALIAMAGDTSLIFSDTLAADWKNETDGAVEFTPLPDWNIDLATLKLERVSFGMDKINSNTHEYGMDFDHLLFENINLDLEKFSMASDRLEVKINRGSFAEKGGAELKNLSCLVSITDSSASIEGLAVQTGLSSINGAFQTYFENMPALIENPGTASFNLNMRQSSVNTSELFFFAGINPDDSVFAQYKNLDVNFSVAINGMADDFEIEKLKVRLLDNTRLSSSGSLTNVTHPEKITFTLVVDTLTADRKELIRLSDSSYFNGISLPESFHLSMSANGSPDSVMAVLKLNSGYGDVHAQGFYFAAGPTSSDSAYLSMDLMGLNVGELIADTTMGCVDITLEASGSALLTDTLTLQTAGTIHSAGYMDYTYHDINFEGNIHGSKLHAALTSHDRNAEMKFVADADLAKPDKTILSSLEIATLNLSALNFSANVLGFRGKIDLAGSYTSVNELKAEISVSEGQILTEDYLFDLEPVFIHPVFTPESSFLEFRSSLLSLNFTSNISMDQMANVLTLAAKKYLGLSDSLEIPAGRKIDFGMNINLPEEFRINFLPDIEAFSLEPIIGNYTSDNNQLNVNIKVPEIKWNKFDAHGLHLKIDGKNDSLVFSSGLQQVYYDTLLIGKINISELIRHGEVKSSISITGEQGNSDYLIKNNIYITDDLFKLSFAENGLIMNGKIWHIPPDNMLEYGDSALFVREFIFTESDQKFGMESREGKNVVKFQNFGLSNFLGIIKIPGDLRILNGILNANIELPVLEQYEGIKADITINDFGLLKTRVGDIQFNLTEMEEKLDMKFSLKSDKNKVFAYGMLGKSEHPQKIDFNIDVDIKNPQTFEVFSMGEISNTEGVITGKVEVGGYIDDPVVQGSVNFKDTRMRINQLNLMATMHDETINFDRKGINFNEFIIIDDNGGKFELDGSVLTENYQNPAFDLNVNAKGFQAINSTKNDNPVFYGAFIFDADITLSGDAGLPKIDAEIEVREGTNINYVMPGSEIEMISSEGIVNFINPDENVDSSFRVSRNDYLSDSIMSKFQGFDINSQLIVHPEAKFTVVINPISGDYSSVSGKANLNFALDPSGSQTLTGEFEVTEGIYQLSFYGLVKKTFAFQPGSTIAWSGNVLDANLNFTASHIVRTQSVALVANESANMTDAEKNMFKQRLPYEVLLNLNGFISEPEVSFNISLPEKYQINYPAISSKLTLLNSGQYNSELNKQVFALLVTGSFIADNPYSSTGGSVESFATTAARNSVNGILADQLNKVSSRYIKNIDMNFGLTSYEEFSGGSSQTRTELDVQVSKKLMNDRLIVEASGSFDVEGERQYTSTSTSHTYGEFSVTYNLTESGEYKLRAYRENAYDLFDGEVAYSGLAFIIERSFQSLFKRKKETRHETQKNENDGK